MKILAFPLVVALVSLSALADEPKGVAPQGEKEALNALRAELADLWSYETIAKAPLDVDVVCSRIQGGYKIEGIYINGAGSVQGKDRIFFYYARPVASGKKVPALIDLTAGSKDDTRALYLAKDIKGACVDLEWRCADAPRRSQWMGGEPPPYRANAPLKAQSIYRVTTAARRVIDFLAQQDDIDPHKIAAEGGSMGGYLTLMLAALDHRVSVGVVEVAGGHLDNSNCEQGIFHLSPERKELWLRAFDPYRYAGAVRAKTILLLSSTDHFFALGDGIETFRALPSEKRLCIDVNFDHSVGSFGGRPKYPGLWKWLEYGLGRVESYPSLTQEIQHSGNRYWVETGPMAVKEAVLAWSPGENILWQARYWKELKATRKGDRWEAEIPAPYADLPKWVFMNVYSSSDQMVSTIPVLVNASGPKGSSAPLWEHGQLWDVQSGLAAWRPVVSADRKIPRKANITLAAPNGISIGPDLESYRTGRDTAANYPGEYGTRPKSAGDRFIVLTSSIVLASAQAQRHKGLDFEIDGNGIEGELKIILFRDYASASGGEAFKHILKYAKDSRTYFIPWSGFGSAREPGQAPFPFDTLWLEGEREDSTPITIKAISFADSP